MVYMDEARAIVTPEAVLTGISGVRDETKRLERNAVVLAVEWAKHYPGAPVADHSEGVGPPPRPHDARPWVWAELAMMGCLSFDDTALAEFAVAAGLTDRSARRLMRESLMLVHLLPRVWQRVLNGGLDVWRARALAADCWGLPSDVIEALDVRFADSAARVTQGMREAAIEEELRRREPEQENAAEREVLAARGVQVHFDQVAYGVVPISGFLNLPDALALESALIAGAQAFGDSAEQLGVRRAWALGDLARAATGEEAEREQWDGTGAKVPTFKVFVHLREGSGVTRVQGSRIAREVFLSAGAVKEWLTRPSGNDCVPEVSIREVVSAGEAVSTPSYAPTARMRDQVHLSHNSCVFPFCAAPAWTCDVDHNEPWKSNGKGGATCMCNLAPLCRRHHRIKTHSDSNRNARDGLHSTWTYAHLGGGDYYWHGPKGLGFIRTERGTFEAAGTGGSGAPVHPQSPITPAERVRLMAGVIDDLLSPTPIEKEPNGELEKAAVPFAAWHVRSA